MYLCVVEVKQLSLAGGGRQNMTNSRLGVLRGSIPLAAQTTI